MEPVEIKEKQPTLIVGDSPADQTKSLVTAQSRQDNAARLEPSQDKDSGQGPLGEVKKEAPIVITATDIFVLFCLLTATISLPIFMYSQLGRSLAPVCYLLLSVLAYSYWLQDLVINLHKAKAVNIWLVRFDKIATIHPIILASTSALLVGLSIQLASPDFSPLWFGPLRSCLLFLSTLAVIPIFRWFYLAILLGPNCARQIKLKKDQRLVSIIGFLVTTSIFIGPLFSAISPACITILTLVTGVGFIFLRNMLIAESPETYLNLSQMSTGQVMHETEGELQIKYNHFVEVQKWFKQRLALSSPWKTGLLLLILLAAAAGNLHGNILQFLVDHIANIVSSISPDRVAGASVDVKHAFHSDALANRALVTSFGWAVFFFSVYSLTIFVRAPKKLIAGKHGLRLLHWNVASAKNRDLPWGTIKHIKIERPKGKTNAASDRLIFEKYTGEPLVLKLGGIASAQDREKLLGVIDRYAPEISREAAIEETLRKPIEQNYTELWLQALAAPPKREKLKPLIANAILDDGRYLVKHQLGMGGQGFAYLAVDKRRDKEVVLKEFVLPVFVDINARRQSLESFEKEAKLLTSLNHPQVVKLEGFFVEDHRAYLVLEHIDGQNLRELVEKEGPMPEERITNLARQMCDILTYLHGLSPPLVHRDFTPDNLILHKDGTLKLIDFNVAQQVEYATTGTVVGKQAYLPPEQFRGQAVPGSDLYAFGATLYFLAAGKDPTPISVSKPIKDGVTVSAELDFLITWLTQMEAEARPANAKAVAETLGIKANDKEAGRKTGHH